MAKKQSKKTSIKKSTVTKVETKPIDNSNKDRLYREAIDIRDKMIKLKTDLETNAVPLSEVEILTEQYNVMHQYVVILNTRLSRL